MKDKNGTTIKTGDIVRISGAYFKNDNGTYYVEHSPGDPTWNGAAHSLRKICRNGRISNAKYNICFWPISCMTNDRTKNTLAREHNEEHAAIEVITTIDNTQVAEHFETEAENVREYAERFARWNFGEDSEVYNAEIRRSEFLQSVADEIRAK